MASPSQLILVDSSVWIDYYRPQGSGVLKKKIQTELKAGTLATMGMIAVEVLQGAPNSSVWAALQEDFLGLEWFEVTQPIWIAAGRLGAELRQAGSSLPATDVLIAATALHYRSPLWHQDEDFNRLARQVSAFQAIDLS